MEPSASLQVVLDYAAGHARRLQSEILTEHLAIGLLRLAEQTDNNDSTPGLKSDADWLRRLLTEAGLSVNTVSERLEHASDSLTPGGQGQPAVLSARCLAMFKAAEEEAAEHGHARVGIRHLLTSLVLDESPAFLSAVNDTDGSWDALRAGVGLRSDHRSTPVPLTAANSASDTDPPSSSLTEQPPHIDGYRIISRLGLGGMGVVWRAEQLSTHRLVALKLVAKDTLGSERVLRRFEREVELAARLKHPNIARVYDSGLDRGVYYYAMELVDGVPLERFVKDQQCGRRQTLELIQSVCGAVEHAHQRGVIHRDLKPSNVLVDNQGEPHVLDFGLAKVMAGLDAEPTAEDPMVSVEGELAGTPAFMSPEQAAGRTDQIDTRSDVFSIGVMLFRLLTGKPPHDLSGSRVSLLRRVATEPVRFSAEIRETLGRDLTAMLKTAMAHDPEHRYTSAAEMARDIDNYIEGRPLIARPHTAGYVLGKYLKHHKTVFTLTVALVVIITALVSYHYRRVTHERDTARTAQVEADKERRRAESERVRATHEQQRSHRRLVDSCVIRGNELMNRDDLAGALLWFSEALKLDKGDPTYETRHRIRLGVGLRQIPEQVQMWFHRSWVRHAEFSPDGTRVATAGWDGVARIWDVATGKAVTGPLHHLVQATYVAFSRDGRWVVTSSRDKTVRVWDATTGEAVTNYLKHAGLVRRARFNDDATQVLTAGHEGAVLWDVATSSRSAVQLDAHHRLNDAVFSSDGGTVLTASSEGTAQLFDLESGDPILPPLEHRSYIYSCSFSPDGTMILTASYDGTAQLWDARTGEPLIGAFEHESFVFDAQFSPDGEKVVTSGSEGSARIWSVRTGQALTAPLPHKEHVYKAEFSPDGKYVATASHDETVRVWDTRTGNPVTAPLQHLGLVYGRPRFSPDGRYLLTYSYGGEARLWDWSKFTDQLPARRPADTIGTGAVNVAVISPDHRLVFTSQGGMQASVRDARTGEPITAPLRHDQRIISAAFSPDGARLVTGSEDHSAYIWDAQTGESLAPPMEHGQPVHSVAFSPDGRLIATAAGDMDQLEGAARIWDSRTGSLAAPVMLHRAAVHHVMFSPDSKRLATACGYQQLRTVSYARVWDVETGQPLSNELETTDWMYHATFSPDSERVVTSSSDGVVRVWAAATGEPLTKPMLHRALVYHSHFSPDGRWVVTTSNSVFRDTICWAQVWDAHTGEATTPPMAHRGPVRHIAFAPNGRYIATACRNSRTHRGAAQVWDLRSGQPITPPLEMDGEVYHAAFTEDGRALRASSSREDLRVWDLSSDTRRIDQLIALTQCLSGRKIEGGGILVNLDRQIIHRLWESIHEDGLTVNR